LVVQFGEGGNSGIVAFGFTARSCGEVTTFSSPYDPAGTATTARNAAPMAMCLTMIRPQRSEKFTLFFLR
jgi:hypothetical protein